MSEPVVKVLDLASAKPIGCEAGCGRDADFRLTTDVADLELCEWCVGPALAADRQRREQLGEERTVWRPPSI